MIFTYQHVHSPEFGPQGLLHVQGNHVRAGLGVAQGSICRWLAKCRALAQRASNESWECSGQALDPLPVVLGLVRGRLHQEASIGKAGGSDGDTVVQRGREDDMVVFDEGEGGGRHACAAERYVVRPRYLHAV